MKKDRNSFFSEYNMSSYNNIQPNMMPINSMYPNQVASQSSFYSGPALDQNMMYNQNNMSNINTNYTSDIESRLSKIERQLNRIESRLNKLEGELPYNSIKDTTDSSYTNNLYMV